jgi:hypothetical protein
VPGDEYSRDHELRGSATDSVSPVGDAAAGLVVRGVGALAADSVMQAAELVVALSRDARLVEPEAQAARIHARSAALGVSIELAFTRASRELHTAAGTPGGAPELSQAQARAVELPLEVCQLAGDLVALAAALAAGPMSARRADLCGIAQLAAGACNATALLVAANSTLARTDERRRRAEQTSIAADAEARRMRGELAPA